MIFVSIKHETRLAFRPIVVEKVCFEFKKNTKKELQSLELLLQEKMNHKVHLIEVVILNEISELKEDVIWGLLYLSLQSYYSKTKPLFLMKPLLDSTKYDKELLEKTLKQFKKIFSNNGLKELKEDGLLKKIDIELIFTAITAFSKKLLEEVEDYYSLRNSLPEIPETQVKSENIIISEFRPLIKSMPMREMINSTISPLQQIVEKTDGINKHPFFQRSLCWDEEKNKKLILSIIKGIPIGVFYVNIFPYDPNDELGEGYGSVLWEGQQRINAIEEFIKGSFSVPIEIKTENNEIVEKELFYHDAIEYFNSKLFHTNLLIGETNYETIEKVIENYIIINENFVRHSVEDIEEAKKNLQKTPD